MAEDFLAAGMDAFRQHHLELAQVKFAKAVVANPKSQDAWLWLARVIADRDRRLYCYQRVLAINPRNAEAATAFQYVAASARPASVQRALAMANRRHAASNMPAPIVAPRPLARPAAPPKPAGAMQGYLLLNLCLILVFLSLYITVAWNDVTTQVQNLAITPASVINRVISPTATPPQRQTPATIPNPRPQAPTVTK